MQSTINSCLAMSSEANLGRLVSVASDGESKRGASMAALTLKRELSETSSIYSRLYSLALIDLLVGDDDLTGDKDYKHVFKRWRNAMLRESGILVFGTHITTSTIRKHLLSNGLSRARVDNLLNPNDKQDVVLMYTLLREIWQLPSSSSSDQPLFAKSRTALNILGQLFRLLVTPYTETSMTLSQQLQYLSAAAHLSLALFTFEDAKAKFVPSQLYSDTAIMIKNVYFTAAKAQVDHPGSNFWLVLLGTDRLETSFGILRTMIGSNANADLLQMGSRLSDVSLCAAIFAQYPQWDRPARRLNLPAFDSATGHVHSKVDHLGPSSWKGDVCVDNVTLQTSWMLGRRHLFEQNLSNNCEAIFQRLESQPGFNILCPFGHLLVRLADSSEVNPLELEDTFTDHNTAEGINHLGESAPQLDLEDLVASAEAEADGESEQASVVPYVSIEGQKFHKSRLLREYSRGNLADLTVASSADRLKRVAGLPRYESLRSNDSAQNATEHDSILGAPTLLLNDPIATVLRCQGRIFLAIAQVNSIRVDGRPQCDIRVDHLPEKTVVITYQIMQLRPISNEHVVNRPTEPDWQWNNRFGGVHKCLGHLVEPINPTLSTQDPHAPTYNFNSAELQAIAALLYTKVQTVEQSALPETSVSDTFPYRIDSQ
jgi:hypothetical protein